jgi:hypothetical protein
MAKSCPAKSLRAEIFEIRVTALQQNARAVAGAGKSNKEK